MVSSAQDPGEYWRYPCHTLSFWKTYVVTSPVRHPPSEAVPLLKAPITPTLRVWKIVGCPFRALVSSGPISDLPQLGVVLLLGRHLPVYSLPYGMFTPGTLPS